MPETSIVIRTYNEEKHLGNLLEAVKKQEYKNFEVVIVDSGSTDRTLEIAEKFGARIFKIESRDFTFGYALNLGCREAKGTYLVFASAHVLPVDDQWLSKLVDAFKNDKVAMVYGRQVGHESSKFSEKRDFKRLFGKHPLNKGVPFDFANNANSAIRKDLWQKHQFDENLFGLEDIEWAKHFRQMGLEVVYEPGAVIYHIHNEQWHQVYNRYRREAIAAHRIGMPHPPQVKLGYFSLLWRVGTDLVASYPNFSFVRIEEILRFRYYQWKGSRQGWYKDRGLDIGKDTENLYFPLPSVNHAVVIEKEGKARYQEIPAPEMKPGDILIQVAYVGICRTDLEVFEGTLGYYRDHYAQYPIIPGHEFSGTIARVGSNNKFRERFKVGDRVVGECILTRGSLKDRKEVGVINHNGAYSKYVIVPGNAIHHIPKEIDLKTAAISEPLAVVLRGIRRVRSRLIPGAKIGIVGAGPIGNFAAQVLALEGYKVTVFDKRPDRLKLLEGKVEKVSTAIENIDHFRLIIEATGSADALNAVLRGSTGDATLLLLGFPYADITYNFEDLVGLEKVLVGSVGAEDEDFELALKMLPKLDMKPFLENTLPLSDFEKAWELLREGSKFKIILQP